MPGLPRRQLKLTKSHFDQLDELTEKKRKTNWRLAGLLHGAQQPRLAKEADVPADTKTRKCTEDAAAYQVKHGDSWSANQVDPDQICLTSVGDDSTGPLALPRREDALANKGAKAPKWCLSPMDMRTLTAVGGLLPADIASTATRAIFPGQGFS